MLVTVDQSLVQLYCILKFLSSFPLDFRTHTAVGTTQPESAHPWRTNSWLHLPQAAVRSDATLRMTPTRRTTTRDSLHAVRIRNNKIKQNTMMMIRLIQLKPALQHQSISDKGMLNHACQAYEASAMSLFNFFIHPLRILYSWKLEVGNNHAYRLLSCCSSCREWRLWSFDTTFSVLMLG